jgi:hypothetical protein
VVAMEEMADWLVYVSVIDDQQMMTIMLDFQIIGI